jgi:hypothetical protein
MHGAVPPLPQYAFMAWRSVRIATVAKHRALSKSVTLGRHDGTVRDVPVPHDCFRNFSAHGLGFALVYLVSVRSKCDKIITNILPTY